MTHQLTDFLVTVPLKNLDGNPISYVWFFHLDLWDLKYLKLRKSWDVLNLISLGTFHNLREKCVAYWECGISLSQMISKGGNNSASKKTRVRREARREGTEIGHLGNLNLNITTLLGKRDNFLPFNCQQMACLHAYS